MHTSSKATVAITALFILGCGGLNTDIAKDNLKECALELKAVPDSPGRQATLDMVKTGWSARDQMGFAATARFNQECLKAARDGKITNAEVSVMLDETTDWPSAPIDEQAFEEVLTYMENTVLRARWNDWESEDVAPVMKRAGFLPDDCDEQRDDWGESYRCFGDDGDNRVEVELTHFSNRHDAREYVDTMHPSYHVERKAKVTLDTRSTSIEAARKHLDTWFEPLCETEMRREAVETYIRTQSARHRECSETTDDGMREITCKFDLGNTRGKLDIMREIDTKISGERKEYAVHGYAGLEREGIDISLRIYDPMASETVFDRITTRE